MQNKTSGKLATRDILQRKNAMISLNNFHH